MTGIYIHIPFCVKKCAYCDFFSREGHEKYFQAYTAQVVADLNAARGEKIFAGGVDTVYIGGGTPTALPSSFLCEILRAAAEFPLAADAEITVEANPGTVDAKYLAALKAAGATRLSFGVQATRDNLLRALGRIHTAAEFRENFRAARMAGFGNINVDLMFALPGQTHEHWLETLAEIISLSPEHISAYSLTPAENTPLFEGIARGEIILPDDAADREMYHTARRVLADAGYVHYEISNFAKPGFESRHNVNCWTMRPYIGFGAGAHSFDGDFRWSNNEDICGGFAPAPPRTFLKKSSTKNFDTERIILGLRMMRGVPEKIIPEGFLGEVEKLIKDGLLAREQNRLFLTPLGMDLANRVFSAFL